MPANFLTSPSASFVSRTVNCVDIQLLWTGTVRTPGIRCPSHVQATLETCLFLTNKEKHGS